MKISLTIFTAPWCNPCKALTPKLEALCSELGVELHKHNVDEKDPPREVRGLPTIMVSVNDGETVTFIGTPTIDTVKTLLNEFKR